MTRTITAIAVASALALSGAIASAAPPSNAKAYGKFCQDQSKKKAEGQKKSDFATCVTAMAHAAKDDSVSAREACKALSKKHVKGSKGTPFSRCRVGVAQMRKEQEDS
jgi:viroplasmin and RNaseH domain-containing protein